ncbi:flagellar basal body-associated FliL family protein [Leptospira haakeii]|uniref:Flagellar protein FliL n=1 Tax=Leptospira haakeii TaxID=2023198 RepID=A0ABX4PHN7_9LEPT|nr:flagellar basal body-associated FliL family protein [Leptospira haakeii]PKA14881.1 hypothetical protein CH363_15910 [Leptospira haakeii]PKA20469.1 hypothetical protein CH377_06000 [Leptospira haakeii]
MDRKLKIAIILIGIPIVLFLGLICFSPGVYYIASYFAAKQYKQDLSPNLKDQVYFKFSDPFGINTKDSKSVKFKLAFSYEPNQPKLEKELIVRTTQIRSLVNMIGASKVSEEFQSIQSQIDLREQIQATTNHILSDGQITGVLISDIEIR